MEKCKQENSLLSNNKRKKSKSIIKSLSMKTMNNFSLVIISSFVFLLLFAGNSNATTYYVSNNGSDFHSGTSEINSWQTLEKVNGFSFQPNDSILFKRGDIWRGQLVPNSGNNNGYIYYGAYGAGNKPMIMGSVNLSDTSNWVNTGNNIWSTASSSIIGSELILNPFFDIDANNWYFYTEGNAIASGEWSTDEYSSPPASYKINCTENGDNFYDIQFSTPGLSIDQGHVYCLSFKAKSSVNFQLGGILLMKSSSPYNLYYSNTVIPPVIDTVWNTYALYYYSSITANDAMLDFFIGNTIPDSSILYLDNVSFKEVDINSPVTMDIGNIIFNQATSFGVKKLDEQSLLTQGDYLYDANNLRLHLYSTINPGLFYSDIECALSRNIINQENKAYVIYENLELKYGSAHGIGGGNTDHIMIQKCDISYIGGGAIYLPPYGVVRYGNGIEFWSNASNNLVEQCRVWEIYDAAMTNQNQGNVAVQSNIIYRNNLIYNAEWSFEYWNRPTESLTENIFFINNTCLFAGNTWAHDQRPDKRGRHLNFFQIDAPTSNFNILNNVFYEATSAGLYVLRYYDLDSLTLNNNCWFQTLTDTLIDIRWGNVSINAFTMSEFADYQNLYQQDTSSIVQSPEFTDINTGNFQLQANSPCIDSGTPDTTGIPVGEFDFNGNTRVQVGNEMLSAIIDIGCYEHEYQTGILNSDFCNSNVKVYPNPFDKSALIKNNIKMVNAVLIIFNSFGQIVSTQHNINSFEIQVNKGNLKNGIYFFQIMNDGKIHTGKFVIE
ncbi:MAG: hypothetical protein A2309_11990 [Bacteroidetes bacterium RIFOXYB2_FULL_35_7]|nr:MAG: hypothetical protein A2X01_05015 [Bacteroidetes bacterium GWF2_35_48]OFY97205.1 MAG: hypothetical protein A2309_11990 [Bacteroidetes bacterium RIFOXYB2_FULL_35_7]